MSKSNEILLGIFFLTLVAGISSHAQEEESSPVGTPLGRYVRSIFTPSSPKGNRQPVVAFLLRFEDFGCLACFENLLELCGAIEARVPRHGFPPAILVFPGSEDDEVEQRRLLKAWRKANDIDIQLSIVPAQKYEAYFIQYSTVVLIDTASTIIFKGQLPLSLDDENRILRKLFPPRRE